MYDNDEKDNKLSEFEKINGIMKEFEKNLKRI